MRDVKSLVSVSFAYWHFFSGNYMWFGYHWSYGHGAFSSPPVFKESDYCSLEFYYQFRRGGYRGRASLSVFIEQLTENSTTLLWSTSELTMYWKRKVVRLPQASYNYSVVFVGYFQDRASIVVDDIDFVRCNFCKLMHFSYHELGSRAMFGIKTLKSYVIALQKH